MKRFFDLLLVIVLGISIAIGLAVVTEAWTGPHGLGAQGAPWLAGLILVAASRYSFATVVPGLVAALVGVSAQALLAMIETSCSRQLAEVGGIYWPGTAASGAAALLMLGIGSFVLAACDWRIASCLGRNPSRLWLMLLAIASPLIPGFTQALGAPSREVEWLGAVPGWLTVMAGGAWVIGAMIAPLLMPARGRSSIDGWTMLNSLCGYASFILSCLTLPLFLPLALILPGNRERWIAVAMRRAMRFVFAVTPTITWRCDGELAALDSARVVVSNHEGMLDILAACALPGTRTLLAKSWVFNAFPLGVAARAAGLRNSDLLLPEDYQEGVAATLPDPGVGIFVFPEGSRSRSGAIGRFRPGAFVLAKSLGCPVVPVAIAGSRLGIRPGSMWIHPSVVVSRVLPPMSPESDESMRAFAARVRTAIVEERHRLLIGLLGTPRMALNRRHVFTGLGPAARRAVAAEEKTGAWQAALAAPADDGDWLLIGCGWSTIAVTLRQLLPAARIIAWEPDAARCAVARHAWLDPERDVLVADATQVKIPERLAGVVCWLPDTDAGRTLLAAAVCVAPRLILVAGVRAPDPGFVPAACAASGWSASVPAASEAVRAHG